MSTEPVHDLSTPLLRQRRNLMIISVLMLFIDMAGATVNKIVFSGVSITLKEPSMVILFMYGFLLYFLYRYYLYLSQETGRDFIDSFYNKLNQVSIPKLQKLKNKKFKGMDKYFGDFDFKVMKKDGYWKRDVRALASINSNMGGKQWGYFKIDIRQFKVEGAKALMFALFRRSYITDYILPYLLALTALWLNFPIVWFIVSN